jgi:ABC-type Fe3+-hydroxamate transport system substrate-binding protein
MRLISLCPSLTELLFDLGVGDQLVGRTRFCVHPVDRVAAIEKVGGTKNPKIERIVALAPDLVFMNAEENRIQDARALEEAGIRVHSSLPVTPKDTAAMVRSIAAAVGQVDAGETIARDIEARAARVRSSASGLPRKRFAYLVWRDPWMTVNSNTFISALLELPGGVNVFAGRAERYPVVTVEEIRSAAPDLVLLSSEPFPFGELHADEVATRTGLPRDTIELCDGELLSWHGSRTPRGIDYAEQVIRALNARRRPTANTER